MEKTKNQGYPKQSYTIKEPLEAVPVTMHKTQGQMDQRPQYQSQYTEHDRRKKWEIPDNTWAQAIAS